MSDEWLLFKWGAINGVRCIGNDAAMAALERYNAAGVSISAMTQKVTPEHKEAMLALIEAINGPIHNDWDGKKYTKDQAKAYIMDYNHD